MRVTVTIQFRTTVITQKKLYSQSYVRRLRSQQLHSKKGKSAGVDNIPAELVQAGREIMIDVLALICDKNWTTGEWPTPWTQSLIITLPKKGNLRLSQNYRTISPISHPSKVMLKVILNGPNPKLKRILQKSSCVQSREKHHITDLQPQNSVKNMVNISRMCTMSS